MPNFPTSKGNLVDHKHPVPDLNAVELGMAANFMHQLFPEATEVKPATRDYNCHGFAFADRHAWFNFPDLFFSDDYSGVAMDSPKPDDVVIYMQDALVTHSALVTKVEGTNIIELQSKWGEVAEVTHELLYVPPVYGRPVVLLRRLPSPVPPDTLTSVAETEEMSGDLTAESSRRSFIPTHEDEVRFQLMLASTPDMRRRIIDSLTGLELRDVEARRLISTAPTAQLGQDFGTTPTPPILEADQIDKALGELAGELVHFNIMLASSPDVETRVIRSLPQVLDLIKIGKRAGKAVLSVLNKEKTLEDEKFTSILLYLLSCIPLSEAAPQLMKLILEGNLSEYNRGFAAQAFLASLLPQESS